jgi:sugar transferase EpsL
MKRLIDIFVSAVALAVLSPLLGTVALLVRWKLGSPVLFRQKRPGKGERIFEILKFRSMLDAVGDDGQLRPDAERLTGFGKWLRATSIDELPGLWNVLRGDMSLVGPRPLLIEYLALYSPEQKRRHEVRPGITGWAQVNGRNAITWEEKFRLDVWYVDHQSFWFDLKVIVMTVLKVVRRDGISAAGEATMPRFTGSGSESTPLVS